MNRPQTKSSKAGRTSKQAGPTSQPVVQVDVRQQATGRRVRRAPASSEAAMCRARARPSVEERVTRVVAMMTDGTFRTGQTVHELAAEWGVSVQAASNITAEASRTVRAHIDTNEITRKLNEVIDRLFALGETDRDRILALGRAGDLCVQMLKGGLGKSMSKDEADLSQMSERELLEIIARSSEVPA
jgi:hypothetical protein